MSHSISKPAALFRSPRRITITLAMHTYERLEERCDREGRSLSNLAAFLLEVALQEHHGEGRIPEGRTAAAQARR